MNILITGGAGFVGTNLIASLNKSSNAYIRVLDNESIGKRENLSSLSCDFIHGDICNDNDLSLALKEIDVVVHLAADTRVIESIENPQKNFEQNVLGSFQLLQKMRAMGVNRFICASTGGAILGKAKPPVHEGMVPRPTSPYGASKLALEGYCSAFSESYGMSCLALRFSNVYGPYSFHKGSVVANFIRRILSNKPLIVYGDGNQTRDYVFSFDIAEAIVDAIHKPEASGVLQLGTGVETSLNDLINVLRGVVGDNYNIDVDYQDYRVGEIIHSCCDITKAGNMLKYSPSILLKDGVQKTWDWFMRQASLSEA